MNDLVIRGALIVDGSGSEPATGNVAVLDDVISAVGKHGLTGTQLVDGSGLVLAPGIVDIHTHYDAQLMRDAISRRGVRAFSLSCRTEIPVDHVPVKHHRRGVQ